MYVVKLRNTNQRSGRINNHGLLVYFDFERDLSERIKALKIKQLSLAGVA